MLLIPLALVSSTIGLARPDLKTEAAPPHFNPNILPPTNLQIVTLDSSFHVTWTPSPDPATAWHVMSVWDNGTLEQSKVVGRTSGAAQANGLVPDRTYTVNVQAMDAQGNLSTAISLVATTDRQSPMGNAAFFENFNGPAGDLDFNYFDVRTSHGEGLQPASIGYEKMLLFNNENHFHTQMIGGVQRGELYFRPRVPFDFANRTGTLQFEVDTAPVQHSPGKWFEVHLVRDIPWSSEEFGAGDGEQYPDSVEFSVRQGDGPDPQVNLAQITVNLGGSVLHFQGNLRQMTPSNVRMPVVVHISQTSAEMLINGVSVVQASGFNLPFTSGYWVFAHRAWYASRDRQVSPVVLQLIHWETVQYDGPQGSFNPVVRTYLQPGCPGVVHNEHEGVAGCPRISLGGTNSSTQIDFNIVDDSTLARTARLLYNGTSDTGTISANLNGHNFTVQTQTCCFQNTLNTIEIPAAYLRDGTNNLVLSVGPGGAAEISQVELEVVYGIPRIMVDPAPVHMMPMLGTSAQNFRFDHVTGDPTVVSGTSYLYSLGSTDNVNYTATVISPETPWLSVSPNTGTVTSPVLGGGVQPLSIRADFTNIPVDLDGQVGVIRIEGGNMPLHIAVLAVNNGTGARPTFITSFPGLNTAFDKSAIPDYHGPNPGTPTPTRTAGASPSAVATYTPTAVPTQGGPTNTPSPTRTVPPTVTPGGPPTSTPVPCQVEFSDVPSTYWAYPYIMYMACNGYVSGYSDGTFRPGSVSTRGQLAKIVVLGEGWPIDLTGAPHFSDVPPGSAFYPYVETAINHDIVSGYSDGTFRPNNYVTRAQLCKIVVSAEGWQIDTTGGPHFVDVPVGNPFYNVIETAVNHGIISGYSDNTFRWGNDATRAQLSKVIYLALTSARR